MSYRLIIATAGIALSVVGCGSQQPKTARMVVTQPAAAPKSADSIGPSGDQKLLAALALNVASNKLREAINRIYPGPSSTVAQTAAYYAAQVKLRANFDAAVSNISFPISDRSDVKSLLVADTRFEDALTTLANDGSADNTSMFTSDRRAADAAERQLDAALTAVEYDVGDKA